jgi:nucleoside 2-deoxyribosyltransferase
MQKIYLAAKFARLLELREYRRDLQAIGYTVTSRWLDEDPEMTFDKTTPEVLMQCASKDWNDILAADIMINFTESPNSKLQTTGGRHVELGLAIASGKTIFVVGHKENVFHFLVGINFFETWESAFRALISLNTYPASRVHSLN